MGDKINTIKNIKNLINKNKNINIDHINPIEDFIVLVAYGILFSLILWLVLIWIGGCS
jgi:hypothetical protein